LTRGLSQKEALKMINDALVEVMDTSKNPVELIEEYLKHADIPFKWHENTLFIKFIEEFPFMISIVADYWIYISTVGLIPKAIPLTQELAPLYYRLLQENNFSKAGRFYLDQDNILEFAVDFRIQDLNQSLLLDTLNLIGFVVTEKFPDVIAPFLDSL
jgi:hypothetical protein